LEMATIVTPAELRSVLGVSNSLYNDAYLTDVIDTAEAVILPMLVKYSSPIDVVALQDNIATYYVLGDNNFSAGQSVVITGVGSPFNGTFTILESSNLDYDSFVLRSNSRIFLDGSYREFNGFFTVALVNADITERKVIPSGLATLSGASTYVGNAAVESAVLAVSVEVFQSRIAPGGQIEGIDFTQVSPYRLGRSLFNRVSGLLGAFIDTDSMVQ
jgi:hypothetical protein